MGKITDNPYPGRRAFQEGDRDHFHGRGTDADEIIRLWTENYLTVVTGPVASGKTSLLHAGVYPALKEEGRPGLLPPGLLTDHQVAPFAAFPHLNPYTYALLSAWSPNEAPTRLAGFTVTGFLRDSTRYHDHTVYAAIDHVEDIVIDPGTGLRQAWRRQLLDDLARARDAVPQLHLLLVARSEALETIAACIGNGARYEVGPLSESSALEAVTEPAARAGRTFVPSAAWRLIDDLRTSRVTTAHGERLVKADCIQPTLLQMVCNWLWRNLADDDTQITEWAIRRYSEAALAAGCAEIIGEAATENDLKAHQIHSWLVDAFISESGTHEVGDDPKSMAGMPHAVGDSLVDRHLLTCERRKSKRWYQLLSDRLAESLRHLTINQTIPPTADDYLRTAKRQLALGDTKAAGDYALRALEIQPSLRTHADAESLLGNVAYEQGKPDEALPHYRQAVSLLEAAGHRAAAVLSQAAVGQTLLTLGWVQEAVEEFRTAVERAPNNLLLQNQLALATWQLGEGEAAVAILNGILGIDGGDLEALRTRGEILADLGDARGARLDLERQSVRDRASARAAHGLALAELGDHSEATKEIHDAVKIARHDGRVLFYAARALALTGDKVTSWELAQRAVDATDPPLSPSHRDAAIKLAGHK